MSVFATITNPTLAGSLTWNPSTPNSLYVGNGSAAVDVSKASGIIGTDVAVISASFTSSGQPTITGNLYLQKIETANNTMVIFDLKINAAVDPTSTGYWSSVTGTLPSAYSPPNSTYIPLITENSSAAFSSNTNFVLLESGGNMYIIIQATASQTLLNASGCYSIT